MTNYKPDKYDIWFPPNISTFKEYVLGDKLYDRLSWHQKLRIQITWYWYRVSDTVLAKIINILSKFTKSRT